MTPPDPISADFVFADIVVDTSVPGEAKLVIIEFETAHGAMVLRLPTSGALELASSLLRLPLEHHAHLG